MDEKEVSLENLDPIFKQAYIQKDKEESDAKKSEANGADKKPLSETSIKDLNIPVEDRYLLDLLGAYGGKKVAQMLDAGVRRLPETSAPPMRNPEVGAPIEPRRAPTQAMGAFDQLFRQGTSGGAPSTAPMGGMPTPVAGGPAGPVGGPASPLQQMGGSGAYNYGKAFGLSDIEAARATDMSKNPGGANDLIKQRSASLQKVQQLFPNQFVENPNFGGIMTPQQGGGGVPRNFVQGPSGLRQLPTPVPIPVAPPPPPQPPAPSGALSQAAGSARRGAGAVLNIPGVSGALGGLSGAESGQEFMKRQAAGDDTGAAIAATGGVGGMMQMMPNPRIRAIGAAVSAVSPLTQYLRDKLRAEAPGPEPTPEELRQAERPAFRYARP